MQSANAVNLITTATFVDQLFAQEVAPPYPEPGVIELLPAWSPDLPNGSVQGIRCRTQATVDSLVWDLERKEVTATISSLKDRWITLYARQGIRAIETDTEVIHA